LDAVRLAKRSAADVPARFLQTVIERSADLFFDKWALEWREATAHLSSLSARRQHPAYRSIVQLGWLAVPLLLGELKERPDFWFSALREITNQDPVSEAMIGDFDKMRNAWLKWANDRNIPVRDVRKAVSQRNVAELRFRKSDDASLQLFGLGR
jgi:hypothetical protein